MPYGGRYFFERIFGTTIEDAEVRERLDITAQRGSYECRITKAPGEQYGVVVSHGDAEFHVGAFDTLEQCASYAWPIYTESGRKTFRRKFKQHGG